MKRIFSVVFTVLLVACAPAVSTAVSPALTQPPAEIIPVSGIETSNTSSPQPSKTQTAIVSSQTPAPALTSVACLPLVRPANGAEVSDTAKVNFAWGSHREARLYILSLISQKGIREDSRTTDTKLSRAVKESSKSVAYYWSVTAYDAKGDLICNPGFIQFFVTDGGNERQESIAAGETGQPGPVTIASETDQPGLAGTSEIDQESLMVNNESDQQSLVAANQSPNIIAAMIVPGTPAATPTRRVPKTPDALRDDDAFPTATRTPVCVGFLEMFCLANAPSRTPTRIPNYADLPFDFSLFRIFSHVDPAEDTGTYVVPPVPIDDVPTALPPINMVSPEPSPTETAFPEPSATEPPVTESLATEPPVTEPPATEPPFGDPEAGPGN